MKSQNGFSLAEILMSVGMIGILSMGVMHLMKNQSDAANIAESRASELDFLNQVRQTLLDKLACEETFNGLSIGDMVPAIKNSAGVSVYELNQPYMNRNIQVNQMRIENSTVPAAGGLGTARLIFSLERLGIATSGVKQLEKELMVMVEVDSSSNILSCYTDIDGLVQTSKIEICESLDGVYDVSTDKCELQTAGIALGTELTDEMKNPPSCGPYGSGASSGTTFGLHANKFVLVASYPLPPGCAGGDLFESYFDGVSWSACTVIGHDPFDCGP